LIYLLDTNVLIDANRDYYPLHRVAEFWEWLVFMGNKGLVKMPIEFYEEVSEGTDELAKFMRKAEVKSALLFIEEVDSSLVSKVVDDGYANNLTDDETEKLGRDPFLIAYCLKDKENRCIVTTENSKPRQQRANRHIPDVCSFFDVQCLNTFQFISELNFSTKWKSFI